MKECINDEAYRPQSHQLTKNGGLAVSHLDANV